MSRMNSMVKWVVSAAELCCVPGRSVRYFSCPVPSLLAVACSSMGDKRSLILAISSSDQPVEIQIYRLVIYLPDGGESSSRSRPQDQIGEDTSANGC